MNVRKYNAIRRFISRIIRKFRRAFNLDTAKPAGRLELATDNATLWSIPSSESGIVECWQICHSNADFDLVLSLLSLTQLREDVGMYGKHLYRRKTDPIYISGRKPFDEELREYCEDAGGLDSRQISHIVIVVLRSRIPQTSRKTKIRRYLTKPLIAYPCDLVGTTFAWASGSRYACAITKAMAKSVLKLKPASGVSWEQQMEGIDWIDLLERYSEKAFGSAHVLQPKKLKL